ncbi:hypothetical protein GCM10009561_01070 [Frigoribacterium faeni]|nr:hypothetical protein GCM10025699_58070 [Microbacterium flavescens]
MPAIARLLPFVCFSFYPAAAGPCPRRRAGADPPPRTGTRRIDHGPPPRASGETGRGAEEARGQTAGIAPAIVMVAPEV